MDLYEYQARDLFEKHGVPVLGGAVATTAAEARAAAETIGAASGVWIASAPAGNCAMQSCAGTPTVASEQGPRVRQTGTCDQTRHTAVA